MPEPSPTALSPKELKALADRLLLEKGYSRTGKRLSRAVQKRVMQRKQGT